MSKIDVLREGRLVLRTEARAVLDASRSLSRPFAEAVDALGAMRGKLVISGIGKSGIVGRRMASVFSSTGTPAFFMHPTEGMHGDIGIISSSDIVILISHSGTSEELLRIIPYIKRQGARIIALTQSQRSPLSAFADITLPTDVKREACPFNLVPTTSSAVTAALGDSLAITLLKVKGFRRSDYKNVHPAGAIGKRLLYRVEDLMYSGDRLPLVAEDEPLSVAIRVMSGKKLGMVCVTDRKGRLRGILTDGDLRRLLETGRASLGRRCRECMTKNPKVVLGKLLAVEALSIMERHSITCLIVVESLKQRKTAGVIHLHAILKAGVV